MVDLPDFSAVILDMDGLILDTEKTYFQAWRQAANNMGFTLTDTFCQTLTGQPYQKVEQMISKELGTTFQIEKFRSLSSKYWYDHVHANGIEVKHGFNSLMEVFRRFNIPYCLATNSYFDNAVECLQLAGIMDEFAEIVARDQVLNAKPAPDNFLQAAIRLNIAIEKCMVVEDSKVGLQAGKSSGAFVVFIPSGGVDQHSSGALILENLAQLAEMIERKKIRLGV